MTIEVVLLPASVVLGIADIIIMLHLLARKGLAIGRVGDSLAAKESGHGQTGLNSRSLGTE